MGDFDNGWREYNWRWRMQDFSSRRAEYDKPLWDGGDLGGKRLLVWSEQGIGDEIMFAGLIPDLIERGIDVILESDPRLVPLFARSFPPVTCIAKGGANQPFDFHIPTGGLGQVLRPSLGSFPDPAPYLVADPELPGLNPPGDNAALVEPVDILDRQAQGLVDHGRRRGARHRHHRAD